MPQNQLHYSDDLIEVQRFVVGFLDTNVFIMTCKKTGESILLDPANEPDLLLTLCQDHNVCLALVTHGHADHIQAAPALRKAGIQIAIAAADSRMLDGYNLTIKDNDIFRVGETSLRAIATPGHTPGSTCFVVKTSPILFSGDTLFPGGPGATRNPESFSSIIDSIENCLFDKLSDEIIVMPGHGNDTTIGKEKPKLAEWINRGW